MSLEESLKVWLALENKPSTNFLAFFEDQVPKMDAACLNLYLQFISKIPHYSTKMSFDFDFQNLENSTTKSAIK
jgi:hypothetical protein